MRTFKVILAHKNGRPLVKGGARYRVTLPCSGQLLYDGEQALSVMESYHTTRPALVTQAVTENGYTHEGFEILSLTEMRAIYGETP